MIDVIKIAVIDDHPIYRQGACELLNGCEYIRTVADGGSAADALRIAEDYKPDLMLLDVNMPGSGIEAARSISSSHPGIKIVFLTNSENEVTVTAAIQAGSDGYVVKGTSISELIDVVRNVHAGEQYVSPSLAADLIRNMRKTKSARKTKCANTDYDPRTVEILDLIAEGLSKQEIATRLAIPEGVVRRYMKKIARYLRAGGEERAHV